MKRKLSVWKFFCVTAIALSLIATFTVLCSAEGESDETATFFGRFSEFFSENKESILGAVGDAVLAAFMFAYARFNKGKTLRISGGIDTLVSKSVLTDTTQKAIVDAFNGVVPELNNILDKIGEFCDKNYDEVLKSCVDSSKACVDIMMTVFSNSRNLPQGVKDVLNAKYAALLTTLEDTNKAGE